jgi:hypothetical protein
VQGPESNLPVPPPPRKKAKPKIKKHINEGKKKEIMKFFFLLNKENS